MKYILSLLFLASTSINAQSFFKVSTTPDTISILDDFTCKFTIDINQVKDLKQVSVNHDGLYITREVNVFNYVVHPIKMGLTVFDFTIIRRDQAKPIIEKYTKKVLIAPPPKNFRPKSVSTDFVTYSDKSPVLLIADDFNIYLLKQVKKNHLKLFGKFTIIYTVLKDGSAQIDNIAPPIVYNKATNGENLPEIFVINEPDKEKLYSLVRNTKWQPGSNNSKPVNFQKTTVVDFK